MNDPWFTIYRGKGNLKIQPRNRQGWLSVGVLLVVLITPVAGYPLLGGQRAGWWMPVHLTFVAAVVLLFIRFAWSRAEIIDLNAVRKDWAAFEAWRKSQKRG